MFCTKCGKEIDDNATFCNFCGQPQEPASVTGSNGASGITASNSTTAQVTVGVLKGADTEITFANGMFTSNGQPLTAQKLAELNSLELVDWKSDEMKLLALSQASQQSQLAPGLAPSPQGAASRQASASAGFTGSSNGRTFINGVDISDEDPYWQEEFTKIYYSNGAYKGKFNVAAFLAGVFWFFAKSIPVVGLIWFLVALVGSIFLYGIPAIVVWVVAGFRANYIRYKSVIEHEQIYF